MKTLRENSEFELNNEKNMMEMASIGDIDSELTIIIRMNDTENIPHFHIVDKVTLCNNFYTCIKIETPEYFHHTGKEDVLNSKQRKLLVTYLSSKIKKGLSAWEYLVMTWNLNNSIVNIDANIPMPDYVNMSNQ